MNDSNMVLEHFRVAAKNFDLMITDLSMPSMTGEKLAVEVRKLNRHIPILICSGNNDILNKVRAKEIGIDGFLDKPIDLKKLAKTV